MTLSCRERGRPHPESELPKRPGSRILGPNAAGVRRIRVCSRGGGDDERQALSVERLVSGRLGP
jgi:hypothetical protein